MKSYAIAAIPGDGIGAEVIQAGMNVLKALAARDGNFQLNIETFFTLFFCIIIKFNC